MATFKVPYVPANPTSWGPPSTTPSGDEEGAPASRFTSLPYAPFGRSDRLGRCADFTTQSFARTGDATAGYFRNARHHKREDNKNLEFQYKVDAEEAKEFQLVDSSKDTGGRGAGPGGRRFVPQARRRANAARLRQLNARRDDGTRGQVGRYNQPQRTRAGGR